MGNEMRFFKKPKPKNQKLENKILDLEATIEARDRQLAVAQVEIETMAAVIARDRDRIKSEGAAYGRLRAESEGLGESPDESSK